MASASTRHHYHHHGGGLEELPMRCWHTLITTTGYIEGVVGLAQSLHLVGSAYPVVCWVTDTELQEVAVSSTNTQGLQSAPVIVKLLPRIKEALMTSADSDEVCDCDPQASAALFRDAARRLLWWMDRSFIFLDADMIVTKNIDSLFELYEASEQPSIYAVPCFRIKKGVYGTSNLNNFNAGLMVVVHPSREDGRLISEGRGDVQHGWETNEEKVLNDVFRGRWQLLPPAYNSSKRCFRHAPALWNAMIPEMAVVHYVGGKPWQDPPRDWEDNTPYAELFELWWRVRRQELNRQPPFTLNEFIPSAAEGT